MVYQRKTKSNNKKSQRYNVISEIPTYNKKFQFIKVKNFTYTNEISFFSWSGLYFKRDQVSFPFCYFFPQNQPILNSKSYSLAKSKDFSISTYSFGSQNKVADFVITAYIAWPVSTITLFPTHTQASLVTSHSFQQGVQLVDTLLFLLASESYKQLLCTRCSDGTLKISNKYIWSKRRSSAFCGSSRRSPC